MGFRTEKFHSGPKPHYHEATPSKESKLALAAMLKGLNKGPSKFQRDPKEWKGKRPK